MVQIRLERHLPQAAGANIASRTSVSTQFPRLLKRLRTRQSEHAPRASSARLASLHDTLLPESSSVLTGVVNYKQLYVPESGRGGHRRHGEEMACRGYVKVGAIRGVELGDPGHAHEPTACFTPISPKDGLLPKAIVDQIHPRFRTPWITTIITGMIVMMRYAGLIPIEHCGRAHPRSVPSSACRGRLRGRCSAATQITQPDIERPFKAACDLVHGHQWA